MRAWLCGKYCTRACARAYSYMRPEIRSRERRSMRAAQCGCGCKRICGSGSGCGCACSQVQMSECGARRVHGIRSVRSRVKRESPAPDAQCAAARTACSLQKSH
eukprot:6214652-Pleurochrysis_carterae.AAC.3